MRLNDRRVLIAFIAAIFVAPTCLNSISAQQKPPAKPNCPVTGVSCPSEVYVKDKLTFKAEVTAGDFNVQPTYNWTVSAGTISSGQGTSAIEVNTSGMAPHSTVTATVDVGGFARECGYGSTAASCTTSVMKKAEARKLDEYGRLTAKDESLRLDNFVIELNSDPTVRGHIISYNPRNGKPGDAQKAADRVRDYLVKKRGIDSSRVVTVTGGSREEPTVELWIVPAGAQLPKPTPAVKPSPRPQSRSQSLGFQRSRLKSSPVSPL